MKIGKDSEVCGVLFSFESLFDYQLLFVREFALSILTSVVSWL